MNDVMRVMFHHYGYANCTVEKYSTKIIRDLYGCNGIGILENRGIEEYGKRDIKNNDQRIKIKE